MSAVFLTLLNMSITASWLIAAVILYRVLFRNAPKTIRVVLWGLVGIRLIWPFSFESRLSLIPSAETISPDLLYSQTPVIQSGISRINQIVNPVLTESLAPAAGASVNPLQVISGIAAVVWLAGLLVLLSYAGISYLRLRRRVRPSIRLYDRLWLCDQIESPFILGLFKPRIYLPSTLSEPQLSHVISHETAHISRLDHWWKPLGYLLLAVNWFNPLVWLAYYLLCRDIELACDEKVIRTMPPDAKKDYSHTLLTLSLPRQMIAACPLAFGEISVKQRIRTILNYRRPAFWLIAAALLVSTAVAIGFLSDPKVTDEPPGQNEPRLDTGTFTGGALLANHMAISALPPEGRYFFEIIPTEKTLTIHGEDGELMISANAIRFDHLSGTELLRDLETEAFSLLMWQEREPADLIQPDDVISRGVYETAEGVRHAIYWINHRPAWFGLGETARLYELQTIAATGGFDPPQGVVVTRSDLDMDGQNEIITVISSSDAGLYQLKVQNAEGSDLWQTEMATAHVGWDSLFLCSQGGKEYLLRYNPTNFQGYCSYRYSLITLAGGKETVVQTRAIEFDVNGENPIDRNVLDAFAAEVNQLLDHSLLLLSTEGGEAVVGLADPAPYREDYSDVIPVNP